MDQGVPAVKVERQRYSLTYTEMYRRYDLANHIVTKVGTYFSPVFRWIQENNKRDAMLIYLTDGYGEHQLADDIINNHQCTLWVLTEKKEDLSLKGDRLPLRSRVISFTNK